MLVDPVANMPDSMLAAAVEEAVRFATSTVAAIPFPTNSHPATTSVGQIPPIYDVPTYQVIGEHGYKFLMAVAILMALSTVAFIGMAWRLPVEKRLFHVITAFITTTAAISYFAMATRHGVSINHIDHQHWNKVTDHLDHEHIERDFLWARYVDWTITTPLLLLDLAFLAGLNGHDIAIIIFADLIMVLTGMFAGFSDNNHKTQKWGWYAIAWIGYLTLVYKVGYGGRKVAAARSTATGKFFLVLASFSLVLWTLYPIVWIFGDGNRKLSVDGEIYAYGILDLLAKPVFGFMLLIAHARSADSISLDGFWSRGLTREGAIRIEDDEA